MLKEVSQVKHPIPFLSYRSYSAINYYIYYLYFSSVEVSCLVIRLLSHLKFWILAVDFSFTQISLMFCSFFHLHFYLFICFECQFDFWLLILEGPTHSVLSPEVFLLLPLAAPVVGGLTDGGAGSSWWCVSWKAIGSWHALVQLLLGYDVHLFSLSSFSLSASWNVHPNNDDFHQQHPSEVYSPTCSHPCVARTSCSQS